MLGGVARVHITGAACQHDGAGKGRTVPVADPREDSLPHRRLTAGQRETVAAGHRAAQDPSPSSLLDPDLLDQHADAFEVLEDLCEALAVEGVAAAPFEGLGVPFGDDVLDAKVLISDLTASYGGMALSAPGAA